MLDYKLDLLPQSHTRVHTPDVTAKTFPYYVTELGYFLTGPEYYTRRDGKDAALLIYTASGCGEMTWKGQTATLWPGSAVVIHCDSYHEYRALPGEPWGFYWVHLSGTGLEGFQSTLLERLTPVYPAEPERLRTAFASLEALDLRADVLSLAEASQCLSGMLLALLRASAQENQPAPLRRDEVRLVSDYILAHFDEPLTTEDFVRVANLSKYHLIRLFRQQMGVPPYRYLQQCRVNRAQELLRTTSGSVNEIAAQVGIPDPVNFIRHFRSITGTTPARYRRESLRLPDVSKEGSPWTP